MSGRSYGECGYLDMLEDVLKNGHKTDDRTGTGTRSLFGYQLRFDMNDGFPLLTTKKVFTKGIIHELLWLISGSTNIKYLQDNGVRIWDEWADENGELGNVYGKQWRKWVSRYTPALEGRVSDAVACTDGTVELDQLQSVIDRIKVNPSCRRLLVSAWNAGEIHSMGLPPCHTLFQFKVYDDTLHLQLYQRSADIFLGVPFNIASYALLLEMVAKITGLKAGEFVHTFGDVHLYNNHVDQAEEQLSRTLFAPPTLVIHGEQKTIDDFKYEDFEIQNYECHPTIKAEVSV